jgi:hypothetical protein
LAVKRDVSVQIGLFDEGYFLYYEDVDLCERARRAGYRVVYIPAAWLTHLESATTVKGSAAYLEHFSRGRWRFILKHDDPAQILNETVPAERMWLARCAPVERQAAAAVYRATIDALPQIRQARQRDGRSQVQPIGDKTLALIRGELEVLLQICQSVPELSPVFEAPHAMNDGALNPPSFLDQLQAKRLLQEQPFVSHVPIFGPVIARLRAAWNSVSTKWYVRPLLQQQNAFNELAAAELAAQAASLRGQAARLDDLEARLDGEVTRSGDLEARMARWKNLQDARIHDHDAWLIDQDREQSQLVRDLAELRLLLIQMDRLLQDVNGRMQPLETEDGSKDKGKVA